MQFGLTFWSALVGEGLLTASLSEQVQRRWATAGGSPDTAILEICALDAEQKITLKRRIAITLARPAASRLLLEVPEVRAFQGLSQESIIRYGILPVALSQDALTIAAPALSVSTLASLQEEAGRDLLVRIGLALDIRVALLRHMKIPLPPRFEQLVKLGSGAFRGSTEGAPTQPTQPAKRTSRIISIVSPSDDELPELPTFQPTTQAPQPIADPEAIHAAVERLRTNAETQGDIELLVQSGSAGLNALMPIFPGIPRLDQYTLDPTQVRISAHSAVVAAILRFGARAAPRLEGLFTHVSPEKRYYALACFAGIHSPGSVTAIMGMLYDKEESIRRLAVHVLNRYRAEKTFHHAVNRIQIDLKTQRLTQQCMAARAAGALHLKGLVPTLINQLKSEPSLAEAAHHALVEISRQDYGFDLLRWRTWQIQNGDRPRVEWLIMGLMHEQRAIQRGALRELRTVTRQNHGFLAEAPQAERRAAIRRWLAWWSREGRQRFSG